ncbi:CocE/NonD family hydrolase, partial [Streptococcus pluranimalium]
VGLSDRPGGERVLYPPFAPATPFFKTFIDSLVAKKLIPITNYYHYFNGKSLATFDTHDVIREIVYVESGVDTDNDGKLDLVKVSIIRPKTSRKLPDMMTASPYNQGVNEPASDRLTNKMERALLKKKKGKLSV